MGEARLAVVELTVRFGNRFAVGPVDLQRDDGIVHLVGPNGSGKTTLLRAMAGELLPASGNVTIDGHDVHRLPSVRRRIALAPSTPELPVFLTVREAWQFTASLRSAPDWSGEPFCEALGLPPTLALGEASAGQRRKAELVCALAGDPDVLLLDETFAHLDRDGGEQLARWLVDWAQSRVVLLTHHGEPPVPIDERVALRH
jgi:ABC-2 type transport system ATP-binding protein